MGQRIRVSIPAILICVSGASAASAVEEPQALPEVVVYAPTPLSGNARAERSRDKSAATRARRPVVYISTQRETGSSEPGRDRVPAAVTVIGPAQIQRTDSLNISDALRQSVPGVIVNEVSGNPFQPDVQFRGFNASPVAGTPQGLAVYQNGVRINEAFGDTVNWDLIPTSAIQSVTVSTNNPAFGLNSLGGALNIRMKDGFTYQGAGIDVMGGSFGRLQGAAQWGQQTGAWASYGAIEGLRDGGFRNFSGTNIGRFYGDIGYKSFDSEFHLNGGAGSSRIGASATVPVELLNQNYAATYTTPQVTRNQVAYLNATGRADISADWTVDGVAYVRRFRQRTVDGNPTGTQPCAADPALLCFGDDATPAFGLDGAQLANPFPPDAVLGEIDRTTTKSTTVGMTIQATNSSKLFGLDNRFVIGSSVDYGLTHFGASAELGTLGSNFVVSGSNIFLGPSGSPVSIGPVSLRTTNRYSGFYALDTLDLTDRLSVTAGGRLNVANIRLEDQLGELLNGNSDYTRFNPLIGATYRINSSVTAYAGYSESNRTPTPLELGCADPARPCIIATFLLSDPPLKQVVSRTIEAGLRGTAASAGTSVSWKAGVFRTINNDDILAIPSPVLQGFGYFQNVGSTRRQGIETEVNVKAQGAELYASYTLVDARFLDYLELGSNSPFADANGLVQVVPGNQIPAIPRHRFKVGVDFNLTEKLKVGGDALLVSGQYFVGDDSNQAPKLPPYAVFNLHGSYRIDKNLQIYGRVDNIFDNRYATYGTFFDTTAIPNLANGNAPFTDPRSVSPARPRAFYAGVRATF